MFKVNDIVIVIEDINFKSGKVYMPKNGELKVIDTCFCQNCGRQMLRFNMSPFMFNKDGRYYICGKDECKNKSQVKDNEEVWAPAIKFKPKFDTSIEDIIQNLEKLEDKI